MAYLRCTGTPGGSLKLRTAQGEIASFETNNANLLQEVKCEINAKQDLHGYDKPWPGGGGKNILDETQAEIGTAWNGARNSARARLVIPCKASTNYVLSMNGTNNISNIYFALSSIVPASSAGTEITTFPRAIITASDTAYIILAFSKTDISQNDINALKLMIEEGSSATPYAPYENICPITGHTEANITRCGVNLVNPDTLVTGWLNTDGTIDSSTSNYRTTDFIPVIPSSTLYITPTSSSRCKFYDANKQPITNAFDGNIGGIVGQTFTVTSDTHYIRKTVTIANVSTFGINLPSTESEFIPFNGNTVTIAFGQTVYGGVLDVTRGKLKPCVEYPSYNGETLSGRWLSSEATYVEGTTPPTGSQVVSLDDYGIDIDLTGVQIEALLGVNNVYSNTGDTEVKYLEVVRS